MTEEKKAEKKEIPTLGIDIGKFLPLVSQYWGLIKVGAKWVGVNIPSELDEFITAYQLGQKPNPEKLQELMGKIEAGEVKARVGEPVLTRKLAEEAYMLHQSGMGTREIADQFTREGNPCSHATVARWINMWDMEIRASKLDMLLRIGRYTAIGVLCFISAYIAHLFW